MDSSFFNTGREILIVVAPIAIFIMLSIIQLAVASLNAKVGRLEKKIDDLEKMAQEALWSKK